MPHVTPSSSLPSVRRRRPSSIEREKTSISIRADVLAAAREIVQAGEAENLSAFVEVALEEKMKRTKRAALYSAYAAAANDPSFLRDMNVVSGAFDSAANDGL